MIEVLYDSTKKEIVAVNRIMERVDFGNTMKDGTWTIFRNNRFWWYGKYGDSQWCRVDGKCAKEIYERLNIHICGADSVGGQSL